MGLMYMCVCLRVCCHEHDMCLGPHSTRSRSSEDDDDDDEVVVGDAAFNFSVAA